MGDGTFVCHACGKEQPMARWAFSEADGDDGPWKDYCDACYIGWLKRVVEHNQERKECGDCCGGIAFQVPAPDAPAASKGKRVEARSKLRLIHGGKKEG